MIALWIIIGLLTAIVIAGLLLPLLRVENRAAGETIASRSEFDLTVYKDQLEEIERDHERGLLDDSQVEAARLEVQRRMLAVTDTDQRAPQPFAKGRAILMILIAVFLPVGTFVIYGILGSPATPDFPFASRHLEQNKKALAGVSTENLLERLKARLRQQPDNIRGWLLLARTSMTLEKYDQAAMAYKKAISLGVNNPDVAVNYAEALSAASGAVVTDEARKIFIDAIARNPLNAKARYYIGLSHAQQGNIKEALQAWVDLRAVSTADAPWRSMIDGQIARAVKELGVDPNNLRPSPAVQNLMAQQAPIGPKPTERKPESSAPMRGPTAEDVKAASEMSAEDRAAFIRSMVQRLADRMKKNPNDRAGWLRLERAYTVLGEIEKAKEARAKADALKP